MEIKNKEIKNLDECLKYLELEFAKARLIEGIQFKRLKEEEAVYQYGLGRSIRNHLGLWQENSLTKYFNELGIYHADDMSGIILTSLHRKLNDKELELEKQIKYYIDYWKKLGYKKGNPLINEKNSSSHSS